MCGIFGYVGSTRNATDAVLEGLQRLDYRGYDSWGVAVIDKTSIHVKKDVGIVTRETLRLPTSTVGIGHTRWATHGTVTVPNAHPHASTDASFVLAHNGIVENADILKAELLKKNYIFLSETDTEVIVRSIEDALRTSGSLEEAVREAFARLTGRNTIIVLTTSGDIIAARNGSPLVLGIDDRAGDVYISSDVFSFAPHVSRILVLDNGDMLTCILKMCIVKDVNSGKKKKMTFEKNLLRDVRTDKARYDHYMLKEIHEAPFVIRQIAKTPDTQLRSLAFAIKKARTVYCIGSGTAGGAAAQIAFYLRTYGGIVAKELIGAEADEYKKLFKKGDLIIAPSQSGETADVLEVLEIAKTRGVKIASLVNMPGSMMTRMSDYPFMSNAGPEICVMSTKVYVSQIAWGYLVAKTVQGKLDKGRRHLRGLARTIETYFDDEKILAQIKDLARDFSTKKHIFLLGKGQNLQIIKEGMVKIVEGAYVHAHAIAAGDLKHYAITLMESGVPVIAVVSNDVVLADTLNATHQVSARGAHVLGIAPQKHGSFTSFLQVPDTKETSAIMNVIPLQLLAYYMAVTLGNNVDKPRNIAKSVTVK